MNMRPQLTSLKRDSVELLRHLSQWFVEHKVVFALSIAIFGAVAYICLPYDKAWVTLTRESFPGAYPLAKALTIYGDYPYICLIPALFGIIIGIKSKRSRLLRFALAFLLSGSAAGLTSNIFRGTIGRPRPVAELPDGAYGPSLNYKYHGTPSAHAGVAFGCSGFVAALIPTLAIPVTAIAIGIGWSRVFLRAHHPTDVGFGAFIGLWIGIGMAKAHRRFEIAP